MMSYAWDAASRPADGEDVARRELCARRLLASSSVLGRLSAEVARLDPSAAPLGRALVGTERLRSAARVGVFSGSFNPLTLAHLALADAARAQEHLDVIVWLLAARTVDKERVERAAPADRLAQLIAYARWSAHSAVALANRGLYVDQVRALRPLLAPGAELTILVGFDKIVQIFDPRYYADRDAALRSLFAEARVLVAPRAKAGRAALAELLARRENVPFAGVVSFLALAPSHAEESSTAARQVAAEERWDALRTLVPPEARILARETGAFAPQGTEAEAAYAVREDWLHAVARMDARARHTLPHMDALVRLTMAPDTRGAALRTWLDGIQRGDDLAPPPLNP